ncbi:MAG: tail fiber domain-containing protein [Desulfobacteraceae bacterium]|nr:tail fiber domain-containing protein [Desulfobacteraceae bacterium]
MGSMQKKCRVLVLSLALTVLIFQTTVLAEDTDSLVVTDSGNIGIGTDSPSEKLEISGGGIQLNGDYGIGFNGEIPYNSDVSDSDDDRARIYYNWEFGGEWCDFLVIEKTDRNGTVPDGGIVFTNKAKDNISKASLAIRGSGNIGIGTIDPSEMLELNGGGIQLNGDYGIGFNGEYPDNRDVLGDKAKIYYNWQFNDKENFDFLVIEKTDSTNDDPDGGIVFTNKGNDNESEISLAIRGTGNIGIGKIDPDDKLDVAGYVRANGTRLSSDARWKENIEPLDNALEIVTQLQGVSYNWADPSRGEGRQIGVIAQEVEQVLPEVVHTDSQGYKSVEYNKMVAPLIEAVKVLKEKNDRIEIENQNLRDQNKDVQARLIAIEKQLAKLISQVQ